jgi:hypothetical protein
MQCGGELLFRTTVTWLKAMTIRSVDAPELLVTFDTNKRLLGILTMVTFRRTPTQNWPMDQAVASSSWKEVDKRVTHRESAVRVREDNGISVLGGE